MIASPHDVENVIATYDRAADVNRRMPGRHGSTVVLAPELADEVMITGDVHGHRGNFDRIRHIAALDEHPHRHLVLQEVCHGGPSYPGGGCMSHTILDDVAELVTRHPRQVHLILGNHELAELSDFPICKNNQLLNMSFRLGLRQRYGSAAEEIRLALTRFLWSCPLAVRLPQGSCERMGTGSEPTRADLVKTASGEVPVPILSQPQGILVTHSLPERVDLQGFDPSVLLRDLRADDGVDGRDVFRLVWGRDYRRTNAQAFSELVGAKLLITGHEPCFKGFAVPNDLQVILDCCGDKGAYVILPVGVELSQAEIVERIEMLEE